MRRSQFEALTETLLRGGIAPRHVRRYVGELKDHYDDLVEAARKTGVSVPEAERDAFTRMGDADDLAKAMLARDDLKSWAARYPVLIFGLVPPLMLMAGVAVFVACLATVIFTFRLEDEAYSVIPDTWRAVVGGGIFGVKYVLPIAVAAIVAKLGLDQRVGIRWLMIGIGIAAVLGGFFDVRVDWPAYVGAPGELNFGLGLAPPFSQFGLGLLRAMVTIMVVAIPTALALRRHTQHG